MTRHTDRERAYRRSGRADMQGTGAARWSGSLGDILPWATMRRRILPLSATALFWAAACMAGLLLLNALSLKTDENRQVGAIRSAFTANAVQRDAIWLYNDTNIGTHQWNDCLVLYQAVNRRAPTQQLLVSPLTTGIEGNGPCPYLADFASGRAKGDAVGFYHRYVHGQTVVARLLLTRLSVLQIRHLYSALLTLFVILGIAQAMLALASGRRREESCFWLACFFIVARWFGLESYGQSIAHAPSDLIAVGCLWFLAHSSSAGGLDPRRVPMIAAVFGALTMMFELLTGGLPLGAAILIGGLPLALRPLRPEKGERLLPILVEAVAAYALAAAAVVLIKALAIVRIFGFDVLATSAHQLLYRMGGDAVPGAVGGHPISTVELMGSMYDGINSLAAGMPLMVLCMLGISLTAGCWATIAIVRQSDADNATRGRALALAASNLPLFAWFPLFWEHTLEHARFMDRILVWTIVSGMGLFVIAVLRGCRIGPTSADASAS